MMYTLSEAFKMFCKQHPKANITRSTFCNCMPDHVVLRANTPADMCPCTYHENMNLFSECNRKAVICHLSFEACCL